MGYTKTILKEGHGEKPAVGQNVTVHCTGYGFNGDLSKKFWSTKDPGQKPFTFQVGKSQVIRGWDESIITMRIGEVSKVHCTPDYAYGGGGFPAWGILPNSDLIFEIEVLSATF
jgi:peptidylprolyl isomerase